MQQNELRRKSASLPWKVVSPVSQRIDPVEVHKKVNGGFIRVPDTFDGPASHNIWTFALEEDARAFADEHNLILEKTKEDGK